MVQTAENVVVLLHITMLLDDLVFQIPHAQVLSLFTLRAPDTSGKRFRFFS